LSLVVNPLISPALGSAQMIGNSFQFGFANQFSAIYNVQYATNLAPPVNWQNLSAYSMVLTSGVMTVTDPGATNAVRFYRVQVQ
jgi:hypothetical protein